MVAVPSWSTHRLTATGVCHTIYDGQQNHEPILRLLFRRIPQPFDASLDSTRRGYSDTGESKEGHKGHSRNRKPGRRKKSLGDLRDVVRCDVVESDPRVGADVGRQEHTKGFVEHSIRVALWDHEIDGHSNRQGQVHGVMGMRCERARVGLQRAGGKGSSERRDGPRCHS